MEKIILISGPGATGKTTAINRAMVELGIHIGSGPKDKLVAANLHLDGAGYSCGFATSGDDPGIVAQNVTFFESMHLDYVVLACRSRGGSRDTAMAFAKRNGIQPLIFETRYESDWEQAVRLVAAQIVAEFPQR